MSHLDEFTLNEYLDHALDESTRAEVESHVQVCAECRAQLDELQRLFVELERLPDAQLETDLAPAVLTHLPQKQPAKPWILARAVVVQLGVVLGFVFWLGMQLSPRIRIPHLTFPGFPALDYQIFAARLLSFHFAFPKFQFPIPDLQISITAFRLPEFTFQFSTFNYQPSTTLMAVLILSVVFLWVVGNVILLKSRQEVES